MDIEQEYYENDYFWNTDNIQEQDIKRIREIYSLIPIDVRTILDAGCGNGIFLNHIMESTNTYYRLYGLDRSKTALKYTKTDKSIGSLDLLPFKDNIFDLVTSLEVIEHLPVKVYQKALSEICRVAGKYVILAVPNNQCLQRNLIECPSCKTKFNPDYHMRSFDIEEMRVLLNDFGFTIVNMNLIGESYEYPIISNLLQKISNKKNNFPTEIPCPVCGYYLAGSKPNVRKNIKFTTPKQILAKFLPKKSTYRWIVSIYKKNET